MTIRAHAREIGASAVTAGAKGVAVDLVEGRGPADLPEDAERLEGRIVLHGDLPGDRDRLAAALAVVDGLTG